MQLFSVRLEVYVHTDPAETGKLDQIIALLQAAALKENQILASITDLQSDVTAEKTVEDSAIALLTGLSAQIAALKTTQTDPATAAAIDALHTSITSNTQALADSVVQNTPAATP